MLRVVVRRVLAMVLGCALAACNTPAPPHHVVVGVSRLRISLPVFLAADRGLFAAHGLDVDLRVYDTAQPLADDLYMGHVDAGGYVAYPIVFLASKDAAERPRVVTTLVEDADHRLSYGLARAGSPLRFPADAAGKRIGILPTVAYRRWLDALLQAAHVDPASVTVVPIQPALEAQALDSGDVDLLFTNDPMATAMIARGVARIADDGAPCARRLGDPFVFGTFLVGHELATGRPDDARRLVAALDDAIALMRRDRAAAPAAFAKYLRPEERAYADRYPPSRYLTSGETPPSTLADEVGRERALGIIDQPPLVDAWGSR